MTQQTDSIAQQFSRAGTQDGAIRPVVWLAALGVCFAGLCGYVMVSWIASPHFTAVLPGTDPISPYERAMVFGFECQSVLFTGLVFIWLWRTCRRDSGLSLEGIVAIAWFTCYWQDPLVDWVHPSFAYNAYFFNRGSWAMSLPGWISPGGARIAEPVIFVGLMYFYLPVAIMAFVSWVLNRLRGFKPALKTTHIILLGLGLCMLLDLAMETVFAGSGLYSYTRVISALSLHAGNLNQFPLYEAVLWGAVWATTALLFFFRDQGGRTILDAGLDRVSTTLHAPLRLLAMIAYINVAFLAYNFVMIMISFDGGPPPAGLPSWLRGGM